MVERKDKKGLAREILRSVTKEMAKPSLASSHRLNAVSLDRLRSKGCKKGSRALRFFLPLLLLDRFKISTLQLRIMDM